MNKINEFQRHLRSSFPTGAFPFLFRKNARKVQVDKKDIIMNYAHSSHEIRSTYVRDRPVLSCNMKSQIPQDRIKK